MRRSTSARVSARFGARVRELEYEGILQQDCVALHNARIAATLLPMPRITDFPTRGRVSAKRDDNTIVFRPNGTNYELFLKPIAPFDGPLDEPIDALLRVSARKVYTVPSGGNFVSPI